jgi:hypothetical protein
MNIRTIITILFFSFISCDKITTSDNVAVLINENEKLQFRYPEMQTWKPNQAEINIAENIIPIIISENNTDNSVNEIYENITDYYFQLIPYLDKDKRKIIYVNSLCKSFVKNPLPNLDGSEPQDEIEWKSYFYDVDDGGNCFWQVKIDVEQKEYFDFSVNGY